MKVRKVRNFPECPVCGANTSKKHASSRRLPFCTARCAADYGQRVFRSDPRCWDVWLHQWVHRDSVEKQTRFVKHKYYTTAITRVWKIIEEEE